MKLTKFIKKLQEIEAEGNGDCPVCIADWYYDRLLPNEYYARKIKYVEMSYYII